MITTEPKRRTYTLQHLQAHATCTLCNRTVAASLNEPKLTGSDLCPHCGSQGFGSWQRWLLTTHQLFAYDLRFMVIPLERECPLTDLASLLLTATCGGCGREVTFDLDDPSPHLTEGKTCPIAASGTGIRRSYRSPA